MKRFLITITLVIASVTLFAQTTIVGKWTTVDENGKDKSIVEIFQGSNGLYYGKIIKLLIKPDNANCIACKGKLKDKPLIGLEIINGLGKDGSEFTGGTITDPKSGKSYKCIISRDGDKLNVRGYVGIAALGRTQVWNLVK